MPVIIIKEPGKSPGALGGHEDTGRSPGALGGTAKKKKKKKISAKKMVKKLLNEGAKNISDADRQRVMDTYMNKNDGGMVSNTRVY